ncbi:type VI secretion system membrane subunit TssM [Enterobacter cloacae]|uniref:type VI secretion system membrane subunit TssM n=1 Tax=Enterobacter cloacae TaxID=550 RepID=UPI00069B4A33|nr:type VI secretion system membrane subunit TssM [Enterobacter cloacae]
MKTLLIVCGVALLVATIWFLGPFFGFGESRPLLSIESRIIFIILAAFYLACLWLGWPAFIALTATLCVIVWVFGPFLLVGESWPIAPVSVRLGIIAVILLVALLYGLWLLLLALKDNPALLNKFVRHTEPVAEDNSTEVAAVIGNAMNYVNKSRGTLSFFSRVILARKPLDVLPWYMVIGTAESGKTSAILASGQNFPLPEQLNQVGKPTSPTRNCESWFANDAIWLDTAGKYISEPEQHLNEWRAILKALKKHRPVKAINGVVVSFSAADVMCCNKAELFELAASLRAKIEDVRQTLGVRFPVYVLVTKLDQLPGFIEYFRILTDREREQVWGVTFPYGDTKTARVSGLRSKITEELSLLEERLESEMIVRQQEEYDHHDRKKMYALPQDFHLLSGIVAEVVHNIFFASRYDDTQSYSQLRGIYFTSSHQPVDFNLLNNQSVIRNWSNYVEHKSPEVMATLSAKSDDQDFLINDVSYGRQYFLKQPFCDVIVKDLHLARYNLANQSKYRLQRFLGHTLCIVVAFILLSGFYNSYHNNSDYLDTIESKVTTLRGEVKRFNQSSSDTMLPRLLALSHYLPEYGTLEVLNPTLPWRYGLYTGTNVAVASDSLYQYLLQRLLLPQIQQQVVLALQDAIDSGDNERIYNLLKLYLQVSGQGKFDPQEMINGITQLWERNGKLQPYEERQVFVSHLNRLFAVPDWRRFGQDADEGLVKYARGLLEREDLASRLYGRIKASLTQDVPADLTLGEMTKLQGGDLFTLSDAYGENAIPGLYTRLGYYEAFKKKMELSLMLLAREDAWVQGKSNPDVALPKVAVGGSGTLVNPIQQQILALYLDEYTRHWQDFLSNIRIKDNVLMQHYGSAGVAANVYMLRMLSASNSPLVNLIQRIVRETTLVKSDDKSLLDNVGTKGRVLNATAKVNLAYASMEKKLLRERVDNHFAPLREFATGSREPGLEGSPAMTGSELGKLMRELSEQYTLFVIYDDALKNGNSPSLPNTTLRISAESQTWPDPLSYLVGPLLDSVYHHASQEAIARSNEGIEEILGQVCRATLKGRYPFANTTLEVKRADFERFFAVGGLVDEYYKKYLADKVDTSSQPWRYKGDIDTGNAHILAFFEQVADIRDAFFQGENGRKLALAFDVSVRHLDSSITQLNMNFDGQPVSYAHWPVSSVSVVWPKSRAVSKTSMNATPRVTTGTSSMMFSGPWSLFRWLDNASDITSTDNDDLIFRYFLDSRRADIEVSGLTFKDQLVVDMLKGFRCPGEY